MTFVKFFVISVISGVSGNSGESTWPIFLTLSLNKTSDLIFHGFPEKVMTLLGVATIDRLAPEKNRKTMRFNSKNLCSGTLGVDAFAFDWAGEFNWLVPLGRIGKK